MTEYTIAYITHNNEWEDELDTTIVGLYNINDTYKICKDMIKELVNQNRLFNLYMEDEEHYSDISKNELTKDEIDLIFNDIWEPSKFGYENDFDLLKYIIKKHNNSYYKQNWDYTIKNIKLNN